MKTLFQSIPTFKTSLTGGNDSLLLGTTLDYTLQPQTESSTTRNMELLPKDL